MIVIAQASRFAVLMVSTTAQAVKAKLRSLRSALIAFAPSDGDDAEEAELKVAVQMPLGPPVRSSAVRRVGNLSTASAMPRWLW
jgi:hypothetical protein